MSDDMTELVDADINRVDLVGKAANGRRFILMKGEHGLVTPATVAAMLKAGKEDEADVPVEKELNGTPDLDVTQPLADSADDEPDATDDPGSQAWEQVDADTAIKWAGILGRAKNAICLLCNREQIEADSGDVDGFGNAADLDQAAEAVDCAISILGAYAMGEQSDADSMADMQAIGKAVPALGQVAKGLEVILPQVGDEVIKAGRPLSAVNETALRAALQHIQSVLATLPDIGEAPDAAVEKTGEAAVADVQKADEPLVAVFDKNGNLVGVVDADAIQTVSGATAADDTDTDPAPAPTAEQPPVQPAEQTPEQISETTPDSEPIPGTKTIQAPADDANVTKEANILDLIKEALAPLAEKLDAQAQLADTVQGLQEQVQKISAQPDDRRSPYLNGATGVGAIVHRDGPDSVDDLRKQADAETDPAKRRGLKQAAAYAALRDRWQQ